VREAILDVYSYSGELPFRIDFFGDEIDTLRTFTVEDQLSKDKVTEVEIVPELAATPTAKIPFLQFLPADTVLVSETSSLPTTPSSAFTTRASRHRP
jgi:transcription-repair coupling factor (superfamily II helicase)